MPIYSLARYAQRSFPRIDALVAGISTSVRRMITVPWAVIFPFGLVPAGASSCQGQWRSEPFHLKVIYLGFQSLDIKIQSPIQSNAMKTRSSRIDMVVGRPWALIAASKDTRKTPIHPLHLSRAKKIMYTPTITTTRLSRGLARRKGTTSIGFVVIAGRVAL